MDGINIEKFNKLDLKSKKRELIFINFCKTINIFLGLY